MNKETLSSMRNYADVYREYMSANKKMLSKVKHEFNCEEDIIKTAELIKKLSDSLLQVKLDYVDMLEEEEQ